MLTPARAALAGFSSLLDSLRAVDSPTDHSAYRGFKDPLEIYAFFVMWSVRVGEKVGAKAGEGETGRGKVSCLRNRRAVPS